MKVGGTPMRTIWVEPDGAVGIIDQTRLPHEFVTTRLTSLDEAARAIRAMLVRGAPLIGAAAAYGLAQIRLTIGAMLVWVFFENLGKGLYSPAGYAGLINSYIKTSHSPAAWKAVMGLAASHAAMAAPMQAVTEISLGILLVIGLLTRPVAFVAFLYLGSLWISAWGTAWIWELLVPVLASLALAVGRAGRAWGVDALLARRWPSSPWW